MKINLEEQPCDYGKVVSYPAAKEGMRSFILDNRSGYVTRKWALDKVVFNGRKEERCDFLIEVQKERVTWYWVELKGKDVTKACRQVLSTIDLISLPEKAAHETRIVTSGTNKIDIRTKEYQLLYKLMLGMGGRLQVHTSSKTEII